MGGSGELVLVQSVGGWVRCGGESVGVRVCGRVQRSPVGSHFL